MEIVTVEALRQIERALQMYQDARPAAKYADLSDLPNGQYLEIRTVMAATLQRWAPEGSPYLRYRDSQPNDMLGSLKALHRDYADGVLTGLGGVVRAELFSDFLEMAEHLLGEGYKDAAAVIVGSVLEGHLRSLCAKVNIPVVERGKARKADTLNSDLAKARVYNVLDQKSATAWLDLRNKAAHGHYAEYTREQVENQHAGVREFIARTTGP